MHAFVDARISRMTFKALAQAIRDTFGPTPGASLSTLHRSWQRHSHRLAGPSNR